MNVRAKMADNYRGDPVAIVTISAASNRPGARLTPAQARALAAELVAAADWADTLMTIECTACGHLPAQHVQTFTLPSEPRRACDPTCACAGYVARLKDA